MPNRLHQTVAPATLRRILDTAHVLEELVRDDDLVLIPQWSNLSAEAVNARTVRLELRRATRDPVAAVTAVAGDVMDATVVVGGANDPAPALYQATQPTVEFFSSGSATMSDNGSGTVVSGNGTNNLRMQAAAGFIDISIGDTVAETVRITARVVDHPSIDIRPLDIIFA